MYNPPKRFPVSIYSRPEGVRSDQLEALVFVERINNLEEWDAHCEREANERKEK